ncbi:hypothetical protein [Fusobacterium ulcerans]|uniref:hypothetical protein n=1 Tax=Fusobacterium ulcerans TaxID=861 RepID=UPI003FEDE3B5
MKRILIANNGEKIFMIEKENQTLINIGKTINKLPFNIEQTINYLRIIGIIK